MRVWFGLLVIWVDELCCIFDFGYGGCFLLGVDLCVGFDYLFGFGFEVAIDGVYLLLALHFATFYSLLVCD